MKNTRIKKLNKLEEEIDENYKNSIVEMIKVIDTYLEFLKKASEDIEKSFIIVAVIASLNSLYEKYMRNVLNSYLSLWNLSKKNKEKELKILLSIVYKRGKIVSNFKFEDILEYRKKCKTEELINLIEEKKFNNTYKSFDSTNDIYTMLVKPFFEEQMNIDDSIRNAQDIIENNLNKELINTNIKKIDPDLIKNINQVKSQILYIYKNIRTHLIHGDFSNFEDIYISKSFDTELFGKYCILWLTIIYISLKNLLNELK